jgi:hypothetical protein
MLYRGSGFLSLEGLIFYISFNAFRAQILQKVVKRRALHCTVDAAKPAVTCASTVDAVIQDNHELK